MARRRIRRVVRTVAALLLALFVAVLAAGCGSSTHVAFSQRAFHIGSGVGASSLTKSVLGVEAGTGASVVRSRFGTPVNVNRTRDLTCWWYRAEQPSSSIDGIGFCITPEHRVGRIVLAVHL
jgi:hypothetical protein